MTPGLPPPGLVVLSRPTTADTRWGSPPRPRQMGPDPRVHLLVVPHSCGGPTTSLRLVRGSPEDVEALCLTPPGHERRFTEQPRASLDDTTTSLAALSRPGSPTVVLGHSLCAANGPHLAHELGTPCAGPSGEGEAGQRCPFPQVDRLPPRGAVVDVRLAEIRRDVGRTLLPGLPEHTNLLGMK